MGKQQRAIPHGRYRLLDDKRTVRAEKLCAIYIEYSWNSTSIRRTTGYRCKVSDWNQKGNSGRGEFRSSYGSEFKRINNVMKVQLDKMNHDLAELAIRVLRSPKRAQLSLHGRHPLPCKKRRIAFCKRGRVWQPIRTLIRQPYHRERCHHTALLLASGQGQPANSRMESKKYQETDPTTAASTMLSWCTARREANVKRWR